MYLKLDDTGGKTMDIDTKDLFLVNQSAVLRLSFRCTTANTDQQSWGVVFRNYRIIPDEMNFFWEKEDDGLDLVNGGKTYKRPHMKIRKDLNNWIKRIYDPSNDERIIHSESSDITKHLRSYKIFPGTVVDYQDQEWLVISSISYCLERKAVMLLPVSINRPERPYYSLDIHSSEWIRRCLRYHHGMVPIFKNQTDSKYVNVSQWEKVNTQNFLEHSKIKYIITSENMNDLYNICDVLFSILLNLKWAA